MEEEQEKIEVIDNKKSNALDAGAKEQNKFDAEGRGNSDDNSRNKGKRAIFRLRYIIPLLLIIIVGLFFFAGGWKPIADEISRQKEWKINNERAAEGIRLYEEAIEKGKQILTSDVYGGKTPQETLDMFIAALESGDMELAAKYFVLDGNLSRQHWEDGLKKAYENGEVPRALFLLKKVEPSKNNSLPDVFNFVVIGDSGAADYILQMTLNEYSNVWKIESL